MRVDTVPDPKLQAPTDVIIEITASGIGGSDLHLCDGYMPTAVEEPRRDDGARRSFGRRIDTLDEASRLGAPGDMTDDVDPCGVDVNAGLDRGRAVDAGKGYGKVAESLDLCGEESALGREKGPSFN